MRLISDEGVDGAINAIVEALPGNRISAELLMWFQDIEAMK
jgi:hypothetical protein